jgi:hypothetical protein
MKVLREVNGFKLNEGTLMSNGLFNVSNDNNETSFWFDDETKDDMLNMSDEEFTHDAIALINYANNVYSEADQDEAELRQEQGI